MLNNLFNFSSLLIHIFSLCSYLFSLGNGVSFPTRTEDNDGDNLLANRQRWMEEGGNEESSDGGNMNLLTI